MIFAVIMTPLLTGLGFWQLSRGDEKQALVKQYAEGGSSETIALTRLSIVDWQNHATQMETLNYKQVDVSGHYDKRLYLLLDNRTRNGMVGYEVINLFRTDDGKAIWVNRGWVKAPTYRDQWPEVKSVIQDVAITGHIYVPAGRNFTLATAEKTGDWPRRVQSFDIDELNHELITETYPFTLRLIDESQPGALKTGWSIARMSPEKHFGYAFQWFSLAVLLVVMTVIAIAKNNGYEVEHPDES